MRYTNLKFQDIERSIDSVDLQIEATDELIEITNKIRKQKGYNDLVGIDYDNEVYYNFYLVCYPEMKKVEILAICNHGKLDDYAIYELPMTSEERDSILWKLIAELKKEWL